LRTLAEISSLPVACYPNAGLPNEEGEYEETPERLAGELDAFIKNGWLNIVGGCCGTTAEHIRAIAGVAVTAEPRLIEPRPRAVVAGIDALLLEKENYPIIVGERTNVIGSRRFKRLIRNEEYEKGAEVGRAQVRGGAHILDVCMADPDRDEQHDMVRLLSILTRMVKQPIMIDSTSAEVIEDALKLCQGKAIINSINLEDGEERFERVVPIARRYGAAVVVGCIDEDPENGMAVTLARKLEIARRSHELLTRRYGMPERDIIFDPLVFPIGTGDEKYARSAEETIEGVRRIAAAFPACRTILGISNVSFGLPPAGREALNSVFLHHCVQAGLALAIVNSQKIERFASIPAEERALCDDLIYRRGDDPIAAFAEHFRGRQAGRGEAPPPAHLPVEERLARNIIDGTKEGLADSLDEALALFPAALDVVNGPLMAGMAEVGRLFNNNELIVAEVLQSAEAMKAAVAYLEPHMERKGAAGRGKLILATVKGDVHDIGKNLVNIIVSNNGYQVIDLGIKVPPAVLIEAAIEHQPDAIGLSGLLVKSAKQMVVTAEDLKNSGITCPILVGGAALSERFTASKIAPATDSVVAYARDAMQGLEIANHLLDEETAEDYIVAIQRSQERLRRGGSASSAQPVATYAVPDRSPKIRILEEVPAVPDNHLHIEVGVSLRKIYSYINPQMLYCRHLGLKGNFNRKRRGGDPKAVKLERMILALLDECIEKRILSARAIWQFYPVSAEPGAVIFHSPDNGRPLESIPFPRQQKPPFYSITDLVQRGAGGAPTDQVALMVTTCGSGVREQAKRWMEAGEFVRAHALQALALEMAEGLAEWVHQKIRALWGFPDAEKTAPIDLFRTSYRGKRYSFGYPACPDLSQQTRLWRLLCPEDHLGVALTEGYMMDPEASVSALVFHHPDAVYFGIGR
ncbi:MAG: vitamin B12 dependent-methionine synthase activation domain-containing protein, partial [Planctomycetota bacterium]